MIRNFEVKECDATEVISVLIKLTTKQLPELMTSD
jgi:hypothetical protein